MILPDWAIREWAEAGGVRPFEPENVNPASLDLCLGRLIRVPDPVWKHLTPEAMRCLIDNGAVRHIPCWTEPFELTTHWLLPGDFVLCHSLEHTTLSLDEIGLLFLKSSVGRVGLECLHAGFGDPSFSGQWTWELQNVAPWPIELVASRRIMQVVLVKLVGAPDRGYDETGRYQNQTGPTVARKEK